MRILLQLLLFYLAMYFVVSGLDELSVDLRALWAYLRRRGRRTLPDVGSLRQHPQKRIAIMVPLWNEAKIIRAMVESNLRQIEYRNFTLFLGVYPNDTDTARVAGALADEHRNVQVVPCSRPGPTSKADCLNHIFRKIAQHESADGGPYDIVMLHDAEDALHPVSLLLVNWFGDRFGMVQVPVLPFPTPLRSWTHGVYCDEFAEFLRRDMRLRDEEGAFLPSNGVGTAVLLKELEKLRDSQGGLLFDAECLTEDYELGMKLHRAGCKQVFLPMTSKYGEILATREYFPNTIRSAVRQRSRWISGQCLQSWERHGWPLDFKSCYWFWRDRKGLWGNVLSLLALALLCLSGVAWLAPQQLFLGSWLWVAGSIPGADLLYPACTFLAVERALVRIALVAKVFGFRFAVFSPLRMALSTAINALATLIALEQFATARLKRRRQPWIKTEHAFPAVIEAQSEPHPVAVMAAAAASASSGQATALGRPETTGIETPAMHFAGNPAGLGGALASPGKEVAGLRLLALRDGELVVEVSRDLPPSKRRSLARHSHVRVVYEEDRDTGL